MQRTLDDTLREVILTSGQSVNSIAVRAGIPQSTLWQFLQRGRSMGLKTAQKLCDHFDLELKKKQK